MEEIKEKPSLNIGGNEVLYFIRHSRILNSPRVIRSVIADDLSLDGYWQQTECVQYSIEYNEVEREDAHGVYIECTVSFTIPQETPDKLVKIKSLREEKLAVIIRDTSTGSVRLVGNSREYLKHDRKFSTGEHPGDLNGTRIDLVGKIRNGAVYYEGAISLDPAQTLESVSFNLGGNQSVFIADQSNLISVPKIVNGKIQGIITLIGTWLEIYTVPYSIGVQERERDNDSGFINELAVGFTIAQETPDLNYKLKLLRERKIVMLVKDQSTGLLRLIGNKREYLKYDRRFRSGDSPSSLQANAIQLSGRSKRGAVFYTGYIISDLGLVDTDTLWFTDSDGAVLLDTYE